MVPMKPNIIKITQGTVLVWYIIVMYAEQQD